MDAQKAREFFTPRKRTGRNIEHTSFWMHPETVTFIKNASETTRMPQGTVLEIIVTYYRLKRKKELRRAEGKELTAEEQKALDGIYYFLRVLPY